MHPKIFALLAKFPRVELIPWETPIQYLPNISREIGADVYIKRDDLTGLGIGGNKIRKLEYLLGDALSKGADVVITVGAVHSNHAFVTGLAAKKLGLDAILVLRGKEELKGNYLLDKIMGIETRVYDAKDSFELMKYAEEIAEELKREGRKPYVIPPGGASPIGTLGYVRAVGEIATQSEVKFDSIVVAAGSGGTLAGLSLGLSILNEDIRPVGIAVGRFGEVMTSKLDNLIKEAAELLGVKVEVRPELYDYSFGEYGKITGEVAQIIRKVGTREGIILDPVYTGKAFYGLVDLARKGELGEKILFIHTGGISGTFHYGDKLLSLL
ncbi:pyridoxal-phosphate dependent enzyme [Pyrococcus horikoshii]|uniref:Putative 1-aminocyclopropane-1-carboxylate deaminase n=2 Tax=Pyrococcus horikoshii TaxID=53953 RepID=1A1D_PYRHO|nr:pyridoxal-phosphate dependent enzyme [Pyrococcus horikoshii]O57809.2 RecName: Full=Putative 1-aminocyclopropane-1-carboxylate deaminase; Short=ACC deaminase [Pyrococcus horikoshii OT3]1J0A_A Chain A, 1-aminocyclopropane-1-carboxylate deaminase [Pyrococcus horikoshii OT3]1J0A_B Chain B, 1-aminocyclopropane-1-carboxylate deaminase [Pyrococcus horikoshii OT3]1J0A_C Chain C, 1-aminocyclopropane-1-carboxylate deaminase [Pyrococcus horikoshii OT3]1J0B_A Chain A, 1-aminocyclopropane-1-carboxylate 